MSSYNGVRSGMSTDEAHGGVAGETRDSDITDPESYLHDSLQILSLLYESDSHEECLVSGFDSRNFQDTTPHISNSESHSLVNMDEEVKAEFEKLQKQVADLTLAKSPPQPLYIRTERKLPKFSGRPVKDSDPDVEDWLMDMREHLHSIPSNDKKIEFILDHLDGAAKSEVRLRPVDCKDTPEKIFTIIESVYLVQETNSQLRQRFYERVQKETETIETYSLALMKMAKRIAMREGSDLENMDKVLIDKFVDGVRDPQLKRELSKHAFEHSKMPFLEFRGQILRWIDDKPTSETSVKINKQNIECSTTNQELSQLLKKQQDLLERQQQQIDLLTKMVQKPDYDKVTKSTGNNFRGRGQNRGKKFVITCFDCGEVGHKRNVCPNKQSEKQMEYKDPKVQPSQ